MLLLPQVYYHSPSVTIKYDEEAGLGMAVWHGSLESADLREALLLCGHAVDRFGLTRWLADNRKMKAFKEEDKLWMVENLVPQLLASSLRRMATLVSEDEQHAAAVEYLVERAGELGDLRLHDFQEEDAALAWLLA
ncbi:MAG: hypothetical protein ACO1OQ_02550 [Rufibacter sp.]